MIHKVEKLGKIAEKVKEILFFLLNNDNMLEYNSCLCEMKDSDKGETNGILWL